MNEFEQELNRLLLLKALLIREERFQGQELKEYTEAWDSIFELLI